MNPGADARRNGVFRGARPAVPPPAWVGLVLLVMGFSLPWSSDMVGGLGEFVSRVFNISQVLLILYWAYKVPYPFRSLPRAFTAFALLVVVHTLVTYVLLHPGDIFSSDFEAALGTRLREPAIRLLVVTKLGSFFLLGYAIAAITDGANDVKRIGFAMGAGLGLLMLIGQSAVYADMGKRFAGGYANPNAFAEVCAAVIFLNLHTVFTQSGKPVERLAGLALAAIALAGMLLSASRSSAVGVLLGFSAMVLASGARRSLWLTFVGALLVGLVALATSGSIFELMYQRSTASEENLRALIWLAYLRQWRVYVLFGAGLAREMSVLDGGILLGRIWPPHNTLLQTIVAYGILGLALFLNFFARSIGMAWLAARQARTMSGPTVAFGILCCWAMLMLLGERLGARVFWVMLGVVFAIMRRHFNETACGVKGGDS